MSASRPIWEFDVVTVATVIAEELERLGKAGENSPRLRKLLRDGKITNYIICNIWDGMVPVKDAASLLGIPVSALKGYCEERGRGIIDATAMSQAITKRIAQLEAEIIDLEHRKRSAQEEIGVLTRQRGVCGKWASARDRIYAAWNQIHSKDGP